ncbi:MAG: dihydroorotate dehydrogenase electron transfer subunit [Acidobacteria bacterium]|nr:dihydroorotate dehydrogenase electron transfer subunit [Acidobacteriota bacterium]MBI4487259.1 dihydroorotate dehydrogenase electron transfer subunit [Acidobacteriota bacterium]
MPVDVEARVIANTRLSPDYNVIALAAPDIAASTAPGQFVMVKLGRGFTPLLRRPFSVFEVLRTNGHVDGLTLLSKRVGVTTSMLFDAVEGDVVSCLGPLGRPFELLDPPAEAWMVAGGVGLAPFATLTEALRGRGTTVTLFYGARSGRELFYLDWFQARGVRMVLATEDGSVGDHGRVTVPLERALRVAGRPQKAAGDLPPSSEASAERRGDPPERIARPTLAGRGAQRPDLGGGGQPSGSSITIYACGPEPMLEAVAHLAARYGRPSQVSVERVMGCGLGGCYSCVIPVREGRDGWRYVRSCIGGPVFAGADIVWD